MAIDNGLFCRMIVNIKGYYDYKAIIFKEFQRLF